MRRIRIYNRQEQNCSWRRWWKKMLQHKRNSIAKRERRLTRMLAFPPLCGFAAFLSEAVRMRKPDRSGREAVRELGGGWRARASCAPWRTRFSRPVRIPCSQSPFPVNNHPLMINSINSVITSLRLPTSFPYWISLLLPGLPELSGCMPTHLPLAGWTGWVSLARG